MVPQTVSEFDQAIDKGNSCGKITGSVLTLF
jgi:hypothetical protein